MEDNTLVMSSFSATIKAPIDKVDTPPGALACRRQNTNHAHRLTILPA